MDRPVVDIVAAMRCGGPLCPDAPDPTFDQADLGINDSGPHRVVGVVGMTAQIAADKFRLLTDADLARLQKAAEAEAKARAAAAAQAAAPPATPAATPAAPPAAAAPGGAADR